MNCNIKRTTKIFEKEKLTHFCKVSSEMIFNKKIELGQIGDDFVRDLWTIRMEGYILSNMVEERIITVHCPKPTFLDWLFGRGKTAEFKIQAKDIIKSPPALPENQRVYIIERKF